MSDRDFLISASKIKRYNKCPKQYKYRYVDKKEPTKKRKGYLTLGSTIHKTLEEGLEEGLLGGSEDKVRRRLKKKYREVKSRSKYDTYLLNKKQKEDAKTCLETATRYIASNEEKLRDIEAENIFKLNEIKEKAIAIMDVTTDEAIWDWKTGSIRDDTKEQEVIQGVLYMAGYKDMYGEIPNEIRFIYLKEEKVRKVDPSEDKWEEMMNYAKKLNRGRNANRFPAKPGSKCYFCDWEYFCDASPVGVGDLDYEKF